MPIIRQPQAIRADPRDAIVDQIVEYGDLRRGSLGIALQDPTAPLPQDMKQLAQGNGAMVVKVGRQSTADQAGLKSGDVVIEIDSAPVHNASHLRARLALLRIAKLPSSLCCARDGRSSFAP